MQNDEDKPNRKVYDPNTARFLRKQYQKDGVDQIQQAEDANFMADPSISINKYAKKKTQKNLQRQVQYFGHAIQPFHMRQQENMGNIDQQGFFVFKKNRGIRDAWLDSINEGQDAQIADKLVKKIKTQGRFQTVYEANDKLNDDLRNNEEQEESDNQNKQDQQQDQEEAEQKQQNIQINTVDLIEMMLQFIPTPKMNANNYMKKLKQEKKMDQYNKLLTISNQYIQKTGEYDILTKKKFQLENMLEELKVKNGKQEKQEQIDWDKDSEEDKKQQFNMKKDNKQLQQIQMIPADQSDQPQIKDDDDEDNIF